ncbi:hypothetical protein [Anaeromyxobacter oryzisoli]|uniref:hypothetical protein n=1 Tax=Anaeromyxobacter oryzisoli TaxID=2925408 RepID=UPI001F5A279A|nr:hypothetical protein [Anaeromyxobacter sp. SG63]
MSSVARSGCLVALWLAVIACGGGGTTHDDPSQPTPYCSVAFTGGLTGTYACHVALKEIGGGAWQLTLNTVGSGAPAFQVEVSWPGKPSLYTPYTLALGTVRSAVATAQPVATPTSQWAAGPAPTVGAVSTTLTSFWASVSQGPCGDLSATLVPTDGSTASEPVQVTAEF